MVFDEFMTDFITVYDKGGSLVVDNVNASVQGGSRVLTESADFPVEIGYFIERKIRTGVIEKYRVLEPNYCGGLDEIPAHYQMKVVNVNADPDLKLKSTSNIINVSGDNASVYQNSTDNSTNTYSINDFHKVLSEIKSKVVDLDLDDIDMALATKAITKITEEVDTGSPNKDRLGAYISLLPTVVASLESVLNLAAMAGLR